MLSGETSDENASKDVEQVGLTDLSVVWLDKSGATCSHLLLNVNLDWTLAHLKKVCADALQLSWVQPQDFNEDMDHCSLAQLSIGTSDLPFAIEFDRLNDDKVPVSTTCKRESPVKVKVAPSPSPFAERQARQDATDIIDGWLFLGGQTAAGCRTVLQDLKITHVLNCCERLPCKFKKTFTYLTISLFDIKTADARKHFDEALAFVDEAKAQGGGILIHCMVGASRSTTFVLAWMISRLRMTLAEAFPHVRQRRAVAKPNRGFCQQLMDYETEQLGSCSFSLAGFGYEGD